MKEEKKQIMSKGFKRLYWFMIVPASLYVLYLMETIRINYFIYHNSIHGLLVLRLVLALLFLIISFYLFKKSLKNNNKIAHLILFLFLAFLIIISLVFFINIWGHMNLAFAGIWGLFIIATPFYYGGTAIFLVLEFYRYLRKDKNQVNQV